MRMTVAIHRRSDDGKDVLVCSVQADRVGKTMFAVHRTLWGPMPEDPKARCLENALRREKAWTVTHIHTGFAAIMVRTRVFAVAYAKALDIEGGWDFADPAKIPKATMAHAARVIREGVTA